MLYWGRQRDLIKGFFLDQIFKNVWFRKDDVPYMYVSLTGFLKFKGVLYFFLSLLTSHKIYHIKNHFLYHPRMYTYIMFLFISFFFNIQETMFLILNYSSPHLYQGILSVKYKFGLYQERERLLSENIS